MQNKANRQGEPLFRDNKYHQPLAALSIDLEEATRQDVFCEFVLDTLCPCGCGIIIDKKVFNLN